MLCSIFIQKAAFFQRNQSALSCLTQQIITGRTDSCFLFLLHLFGAIVISPQVIWYRVSKSNLETCTVFYTVSQIACNITLSRGVSCSGPGHYH